MMTISFRGMQLIKQAEGFSSIPYKCPAGKLSIGYGHVIKPDESDTFIDMGRGNVLLCLDTDIAEEAIEKYVKVPLNQNQYDALVSFIYNVGPGKKGEKDGFACLKNGNQSTLLKLINQERFEDAAKQFDRWVYSNAKKLPGLVTRRANERKLFEEPVA